MPKKWTLLRHCPPPTLDGAFFPHKSPERYLFCSVIISLFRKWQIGISTRKKVYYYMYVGLGKGVHHHMFLNHKVIFVFGQILSQIRALTFLSIYSVPGRICEFWNTCHNLQDVRVNISKNQSSSPKNDEQIAAEALQVRAFVEFLFLILREGGGQFISF